MTHTQKHLCFKTIRLNLFYLFFNFFFVDFLLGEKFIYGYTETATRHTNILHWTYHHRCCFHRQNDHNNIKRKSTTSININFDLFFPPDSVFFSIFDFFCIWVIKAAANKQAAHWIMVFIAIVSAIFNVPVLISLLLIVFFASIGISLGVRRAYIKVLLKIFEVCIATTTTISKSQFIALFWHSITIIGTKEPIEKRNWCLCCHAFCIFIYLSITSRKERDREQESKWDKELSNQTKRPNRNEQIEIEMLCVFRTTTQNEQKNPETYCRETSKMCECNSLTYV